MTTLPVLWHLKVSHYNEKARWALDHKCVPHIRRAAMPGRHQAIAKRLTGGTTLPVLVLEDGAVGDSTRIIETLEEREPKPPLYPADPDERRRALEIEDFFDEELGPETRMLVLHHTLPDGKLTLGVFTPDLRGARRLVALGMWGQVRKRLAHEFTIDDDSVAAAYDKVRAAGERFRAELGPTGYLVGDEFTVADLTLAALCAPAVAPVQFPYPQPQRGHPAVEPLREALAASGLLDWTRDMYARHRGTSAEVAA
jgi:glutathione S-transferase